MKEKSVILNKEMLEKLKKAGAVGVSIKREFKYVPLAYRAKDISKDEYLIPKSLWPVFTLKSMSGTEQALMPDKSICEVIDNKDGTPEIKVKAGALVLDLCKSGIINWNNLHDEDGKLIPKPTKDGDGLISINSLDRLSGKLLQELSEAIIARSKMSEEEELGLK